jgi:alanine racemase
VDLDYISKNMEKEKEDYIWVECDLNRIKNNYRIFSEYVSPAICSAVIKDDAYGLGANEIGNSLFKEGCRYFFVAYSDEADSLAKSIWNKQNVFPSYEIGENKYSLFVLNGPFLKNWCKSYEEQKYIPVLNTLQNIIDWNDYAKSIKTLLPAILHIDTGMRRLGLPYEEFVNLKKNDFEYIDLRFFMSHLVADSIVDHVANKIQIEKVKQIRNKFPDISFSLSATNGTLQGAHMHHDMVRIGVGLYGFSNYLPGIKNGVKIYGKILQIQDAQPGEGIGYDWTFITKEEKRLATVSCGYADGIIHAQNTVFKDFIIGGKSAPILGKVSMDLTIVDITNIGGVKVGDEAVIFGDEKQLQYLSKEDMLMKKFVSRLGKRIKYVYNI